MRLVDRAIEMSRRGLLQVGIASGAAYIALSGTGLVLGKGNARAATLKVLSPHQHATLMRFTRDLFPHKQFNDAIYASAITPLAGEAAKDPATRALLAKGVKALDALTMKNGARRFADTPDEAKRIAAIKQIQETPFFAKVYGSTRSTLYNERTVWPILGFQGPSSPKGGYLHRGFNDLNWL